MADDSNIRVFAAWPLLQGVTDLNKGKRSLSRADEPLAAWRMIQTFENSKFKVQIRVSAHCPGPLSPSKTFSTRYRRPDMPAKASGAEPSR
jgi:hypothetical protein